MLVLGVSNCSAALCCAVPCARSSHTTPTSRGLGAGRPGKEQAHGLVRFLHSRTVDRQARQARQPDRQTQARPGKAAFPIPDIKTIINLVCPSIIHLRIYPYPYQASPCTPHPFPPTPLLPASYLGIYSYYIYFTCLARLPRLLTTPLLSPPLLTYLPALLAS